jgi:hypothetical protein
LLSKVRWMCVIFTLVDVALVTKCVLSLQAYATTYKFRRASGSNWLETSGKRMI